ncbi:hypothetical protein BH23GEM5_BH23GEM5_00770 [soil metagenome]
MCPLGLQIHTEWETREASLGFHRAMLARPLVAYVGQFLLAWILVLAATVLVVGGHRRVVIARDPFNPESFEQGYGFVWPGRVSHQVTQVVRGVDTGAGADVVEHGLERRKIGVDIRDQCISHRRASCSSECPSCYGVVAETGCPVPASWRSLCGPTGAWASTGRMAVRSASSVRTRSIRGISAWARWTRTQSFVSAAARRAIPGRRRIAPDRCQARGRKRRWNSRGRDQRRAVLESSIRK